MKYSDHYFKIGMTNSYIKFFDIYHTKKIMKAYLYFILKKKVKSIARVIDEEKKKKKMIYSIIYIYISQEIQILQISLSTKKVSTQ